MAKVFIEETTLTAIGDAIRGKTGKTELIDPANMSTEIAGIEAGGGGDIEIPDIVLTGDCSYACSGALGGTFISLFPTKVTTRDIANVSHMFYRYSGEYIPFSINITSPSNTDYMFAESNLKVTPAVDCKHTYSQDMNYMFYSCSNLVEVSPITNAIPTNINSLFSYCNNLREIPDDFFDSWTFDYALSYMYAEMSSVFNHCGSLRAIPRSFFEKLSPGAVVSFGFYCYLYDLGSYCCSMDEITNIPLPHEDTMISDNLFASAFSGAHRLKRITFATNDDNTPKVRKWSGQYINLNGYDPIGYSTTYNESVILGNSGITIDKKVTDDATYQALKNDPDWYTLNPEYSRYNHDSAVETINTLPDTSAYLAEYGGSANTIAFKSNQGSRTDGGAIGNLTEEEIAVATAKGWTVTLS